jgi:hypothetical protein
MTLKYDISQFGCPWCVNDHLDSTNNFCSSDFGSKIVQKFKNSKTHRTFFPLIKFENPLFFSAKLEVKFSLTFGIARNLFELLIFNSSFISLFDYFIK